jgi:hypothetical protein
MYTANAQNVLTSNEAGYLFVFLIVPFGLPIGYHLYLGYRARRMMDGQIAQSFGYSYDHSTHPCPYSGLMFSRGNGRVMYDSMKGTYRDMPINFFTYQYTVGSGKDRHVYIETICAMTVAAQLPHIMLFHKGSVLLGGFGEGFEMIGTGFAMEKASLEGDFPKYFDVYVEKDAQIQVREILEPDLMQDLIAKYSAYDIELDGTNLYLKFGKQFSKRQQYEDMHGLADTLIDKMISGIRSAQTT